MRSNISENLKKMYKRLRKRPRKWPIWQPEKPRKRKSLRNRKTKKRLRKWKSKAMRPHPNCRVWVKQVTGMGICNTRLATIQSNRVHTLIWLSSTWTNKWETNKRRMRSVTIRKTKKKRSKCLERRWSSWRMKS